MDIQNSISNLKENKNLTSNQMEQVFEGIFSGKYSDSQVKDFLISLYHKGETCQEILGAISYLKKTGRKIQCKSENLIDCCGTGGDKKNTFNISTAVSFVLAGAGCKVAKHGNKAVSSISGSADILTELGVNISASNQTMIKCIDEIGIGFLFAPNFYPLMKKVASIRKSISHRTIFNILGPLLNPAQAKHQLIGVFDQSLTSIMVKVLKEMGSQSVVAVCAENGMDEFSLSCLNNVARLQDNQISDFSFDPRDSGYPFCHESDLKGGTPKENAERLKQCLKGHSQPLDHVVHINAAWGLIAAKKTNNLLDGLLMTQDSISSGRAYQKLEQLIDFTQTDFTQKS